MCRDVNMFELETIIYDNGCNLDSYILNREPREFEFLRILVDGAHVQGHKRLKRPASGGRGGHSG